MELLVKDEGSISSMNKSKGGGGVGGFGSIGSGGDPLGSTPYLSVGDNSTFTGQAEFSDDEEENSFTREESGEMNVEKKTCFKSKYHSK